MADVQIDNGNYLRIHNGIYGALSRIRIPGEARQVFDFIVRKTYGFNKKHDWISLGQFMDGTGIRDKSSVVRALHKLERMNLIGKKANGVDEKANAHGATYWVNKDYDTWKPLAKKPTLTKKPMTVDEKANKPLAKKPPTKDNIQKTILQKTFAGSAKIASPATRFLTDFGKLFQDRFGSKYICTFKKDTMLVKDMLGAIEYDDLVNRARLFLKDEDDFIKKAGYTIGTFRSKVNKYIVKKAATVKYFEMPPEQTPEQAEAAKKAKDEMMKDLREKGIVR